MGGADAFGLLAVYTLAVRELLLLAGLGIALTSLDDLFIDVVYMSRRLWRWAAIYRRHSHATVDRLTPGIAPRPMAVFVPAWDESEVIGSMLRDFLRRTDYPRYRVFVGVYPNDPDTRAAVLEISDPRIEIVDVGRLGPTTKADCLNAIWGA